MRIIFLNHSTEGVGTYFRCLNIGGSLVKRGHEVTLVCANSDVKVKRITVKIREGVITVFLPRLGNIDILNTLKSNRFYLFTDNFLRGFNAVGLTLKTRCDIIHAFTVAQPATAIPFIANRISHKAPIVVDWDDWWSKGGLAKYWGKIVEVGMAFSEEKLPLFADAVTVASDELKRRALNLGLPYEKVFKVPNGSDVALIRPIPSSEAKKRLQINESTPVIFYGGMWHLNNLSMLINAFKHVVNRRPDTILALSGNIEFKHKMLIKKLDLNSNVVFFGVVPYREMPLYLSAADVFALPMNDEISERARWPMRLGEYLAAARPIVASDIGEVATVIKNEKCGLLAQPNDPKDFSEKILMLLHDDELRINMSRRARMAAEEKYSWSKIAERVEKIYREIIN